MDTCPIESIPAFHPLSDKLATAGQPSAETESRPPLLPKQVWAFVALYFVASLAHFAHNAEYIAFYPSMPAWLTREQVYLAWLAVTGIGVAGFALSRLGWKVAGALCLLAYGALGLDGLGHYTLALCSEHTIAMNVTIWFEAITGVGLAVCCGTFVFKSFMTRQSNPQ